MAIIKYDNTYKGKIYGGIINENKFLDEEIINQDLVQYFCTNKEGKLTDKIYKIYIVGYKSKYAKSIKMLLNKWIPNRKDTLDENNGLNFYAKNEYIEDSCYKTGLHFHISTH